MSNGNDKLTYLWIRKLENYRGAKKEEEDEISKSLLSIFLNSRSAGRYRIAKNSSQFDTKIKE